MWQDNQNNLEAYKSSLRRLYRTASVWDASCKCTPMWSSQIGSRFLGIYEYLLQIIGHKLPTDLYMYN